MILGDWLNIRCPDPSLCIHKVKSNAVPDLPKHQRAVVCAGPNQPWTLLADHPIPRPGPQEVLIKVITVGLCGGDGVLRAGQMPGLNYPVVAGHEIVGRIVALGVDVEEQSAGEGSVWRWRVGQRVGVGWNAGRCKSCYYCRQGNPQGCNMGEHQETIKI